MNKANCDLGLGKLSKLFWVLFCLLWSGISTAQTDTQFWFVAPEVDNAHGDRPIAFRLTSEAQAAQVRIYQPANLSAFDTTLTIGANSTVTIPLTHRIADIENTPPNTVLNRGFLIEASSPITTYYEVITAGNNPDIFALKGRNALGTAFIITGQSLLENAFGHERIDIVATEDSTVIQINNTAALFRSGGNITAGSTFTITLNRGQTYSLRTNSRNAGVSQAGMRINSNKPIALTYIDDSVRGGSFYGGGCYDLLGDQLIPVRVHGQEYIVMRGFLNAVSGQFREIILVTASENNTRIFLNGGLLDTILQAGQTATYLLRDSSLFIQATEPILVAHISGFGCETGLAFLPSIACTGSRQVGFTRTTDEFFGINLMTKTNNVSGFRLNGAPLPGAVSFSAVPGTGGVWQFARLNVNTATVPVGSGNLLTNLAGPFHMGVINGGASTGCRYGYFSDFSRYEVSGSSNSPRSAPLCTGSTLELIADSLAGATYVWTNPAGIPFSTLRNPQIVNFGPADTGLYVVRAVVDGCNSEPDSVYVSMRPLPGNPNARSNGPLCVGDTLQLLADTLTGATYWWQGPGGFSSSLQQPVIPHVQLADTGLYRLQLTLDGCVGIWHEVRVVVHPIPAAAKPLLANDSLCLGDTAYFMAPTAAGRSYAWQGPAGFTDSTANPSIYIAGQQQTGWYFLRIAENGCWSAPDSVFLMVVPGPIQVQIVQGSSSNCFGDTALLQANAVAGYQYQWLRNNQVIPGATTASLRTSLAGSYRLWVQAPQGCADTSAAVELQFGSAIPLVISSSIQPPVICAGDSLSLQAPSGFQYQWFRNGNLIAGANSTQWTATSAGLYQVLLTDSSGCSNQSQVISVLEVQPPRAQISPAAQISLCGGGAQLLTANTDSLASYQWLRDGMVIAGATSDSLLAAQAGSYRLVLQYPSGCVDSSAATVITWLPVPEMQLQALTDTVACEGDSLSLLARGTLGAQCQWLRNGVPIATHSDSLLRVGQSGSYQLIATYANGCSDTSETVTMLFNPLPQVTLQIYGNDSICAGDSTQIRASGGMAYQWLRNGMVMAGAVDSQITVTDAASYQVVASNAFGCTDTSSAVAIYVAPAAPLLLQLNGQPTLCSNQQAQLQLLGAVHTGLQWFRNDTLLTGIQANSLTTAQSGRYYVIGTSVLGCSDTSNSLQLEFLPLPQLSIQTNTGDTNFCAGSNTILRAQPTGNYTYQWLRDGVSLPAQTADSLVVNQPGAYSLVVTDTNACSTTIGPIQLQQLALPPVQLQLSGAPSFCEGDSLRLTAAAGSGLRYCWFRNQTLLPDTLAQLVVRQSGQYQLLVENAAGCSDTSLSIAVNVVALPTSNILPAGNQTICAGDSLQLIAPSGNFTYQWLYQGNPLPGATVASLFVQQAGSYQLVVTNNQGCNDTSASVQLSIRSLPQPTIVASAAATCAGDSLTLRLNGPLSGMRFEWFYQGNSTGMSTDSLRVGQGGNYRLLVIDSFGCRAWSNLLTVEIFPLPQASIRSSGPQSICEGQTTQLTVLPVPAATYQWYRNDTLLPGAQNLQLTVNAAGSYACLVSSAGGCERLSASIEVEVLKRPEAAIISAPQNICAGSDLRLEATGPAGAQYVWTGPANFNSTQRRPLRNNVTMAHSGWYRVQTFENGCAGPIDSVFIQVEAPLPALSVRGRTRLCTGYELALEPTPIEGATYTWFLPNGDSVLGRELVRSNLRVEDTGTYRLRVTRGSCSLEVTDFNIEVSDHHFYFPTAFTPNGDGLNENFFPVTNYQGDYDLKIFDRWGRNIFTGFAPQHAWDGMIDGEPGQPGAYSYVLTYQGCRGNPEVVYGTVFLLK